MRHAVLVLLSCACGRGGFDPISGAHRRPIAVATGQTETLVDFPVGVIVTADAALAARARPDGRDLAFSDSDGTTPLSFEIESYDGATGALVAWVRVPSLAGTTTLYLSYGGDALDLQDAAGTWVGCLGVWHFSDIGEAHDSTAHAHMLGAASVLAPATVAGIAGGARMFDASNSLQIGDPPDGSLDMGTRSFSLSLWVNTGMPAGMFDMVLNKGGASAGDPGYDIEIGTAAWRSDIGDASAVAAATFDTVHDTWAHLVAVADRSAQALTAFTNDVLSNSAPIASIASINSSSPLVLGVPMYPFAGMLDELRIYDHAVSPAWIAAEYRNLTDPARFAALGPDLP